MKLTKKISYKIQRLIKNLVTNKKNVIEDSHEQKAMTIFRNMLRNPDSKFTIAPVSGKRYIVNKPLDIFILIDDSYLEITNHIYHYEIKLRYDNATKLIKLFNSRVESDAISYEQEIKSNIQMSLDTILTNVSKLK